jgi:hypothetical protein
MRRLTKAGTGLGLIAAIAALAALASPGMAATSGTDRQTASVTFTTSRPGTPTGLQFADDFQNPADPSGKPYSVAEIVTHLPSGTKYDDTALPYCTASDPELYLEGTAACPAASHIGGGTLITDLGSPAGLQRYGYNTVTQFNAKGEVIAVAETQNPPTRVVSRTEVSGTTFTSVIPPFPGFPPPDPYSAFKSLRLSGGPPVVNHGKTLVRTPKTCPASRAWTFLQTFTYRDGVSQTVRNSSPCSG